jgi:dihydrofolate reductase
MNSMQKYVVSTTLREPKWQNSTVIGVEEIAGLKERHDGDLLVAGSCRLVQTLVEQDLVDEWRLMVFPVLLGAGKKLFGEGFDRSALRLVETKQT